MPRIRVYDLPTRLFHWFFAIGLATTAGIALSADHRGAVFPYHKIIGLVMVAIIVLRTVWGFVGTQYARFRSLLFGPRAVIDYVKGALSDGGRLYAGHNPGSGDGALAMLVLTLAVVTCGVLLALGHHSLMDVHVTLAWGLFGVIATHLAGLILHTIKHRDNIAASMISGYKRRETGAPIPSTRPLSAVAFVVLTVLWAGGLLRGYEPSTGRLRLPWVGTQLRVGMGDAPRKGPP